MLNISLDHCVTSRQYLCCAYAFHSVRDSCAYVMTFDTENLLRVRISNSVTIGQAGRSQGVAYSCLGKEASQMLCLEEVQSR